MKLLYDASALLNIIKILGEEVIKYLRGSYILTLTLYEVGECIMERSYTTKDDNCR